MANKENYIVVCRKHWSMFIGNGIVILFFLLLAAGGISVDNGTGATAFSLVVALLVFVRALISYKTDYIGLTETKVIGHIGFIRSKKLSAPISKVQGIGLSNGLFGKIFHYHTITIDTAGSGTTEFVFKNMADAEAFERSVDRIINDKR